MNIAVLPVSVALAASVALMMTGRTSAQPKGAQLTPTAHAALPSAPSDFWLVPSGHVRAALFDLRRSSPSRFRSQVLELGDDHPLGVYIPKGIAHGFAALSDSFMTYLVDEYYDNSDEHGLRWDDPALGVEWGVKDPIVSERDRRSPFAKDLPEADLPD